MGGAVKMSKQLDTKSKDNKAHVNIIAHGSQHARL